MSKRFISLFTAILLVLSAFLFAGCNKTPEESDDPTGKNLSSKELFKVSLVNTLFGENADLISANAESNGIKGAVSAEVYKLDVAGASVLPESKPIKIALDVSADGKKELVKLGLAAELLGEAPKAEIIVDKNALYITDLLGVNDKALKMPIEQTTDSGNADGEAVGEANNMLAVIDKLSENSDFLSKAITKVINDLVTDNAFSEETKDVTVGGKEFKGVRVVTLSLTSEMAKKAVKDFVDEIKTNKVLADMLDIDFDASEIENAFENIKLVNTVFNKKTIALDVTATNDGAPIFKLESTFVDDNASIKMAPTTKDGAFDESLGIAYFERTVENGNEKIVGGFKEDGNDEKFLEFNGTYANGKHDGVLKIFADGEEIAIKLALEIAKGSIKLTVKEITVEGNTIKLELIIDSSATATQSNLDVSLKANIEGMADIDAKIHASFDITSVSINVPTESVDMDKLDPNTFLGWIGTLGNKYPKIMGFVAGMMNQGGESDPGVELPDDEFDDFDDFDGDF